MRTFRVTAHEYHDTGADCTVVELTVFDQDKGTAVRVQVPLKGELRDFTYETAKVIAASAIRNRVAREILPPKPDCENLCAQGYLAISDHEIGRCPNEACHAYAEQVFNICDIADIRVIYRPGTHENGDFPL